MTSSNEKNGKKTAVILAILVAVGIAGGLMYTKKQAQQATQDAGATTNNAGTTTPPAATSNEAVPATNANPDLSVDGNGLSKATVLIKTDKGLIKFKFYSKDAPNTVKRIVELINSKFYNGLNFHRVEPNFVIQGGDPNGNGTGGSGQNLKAEFNDRKHIEGAVAMARAMDPDSADSQFYITLAATPHLDHNYTVFGQVTEGMDVVKKIEVGDKMSWIVIE